VASVWIRTRPTTNGQPRYRVVYRPGGREAPFLYAGTFRTKREARIRRDWIAGELAALRMPDLTLLDPAAAAPTFQAACDTWRDTRHDVSEGTRTLHRVALARALPYLGEILADRITADDVVGMVTALHVAGSKKETIRKTINYGKAVLDDLKVEPNPFRDSRVRLPYEQATVISPPTHRHVADVVRLLQPQYRLPVLFLDWSGARVSAIETLTVGDLDEGRGRVRLLKTKTGRPLWVELHPILADAIAASLPPREDRDLEARLFRGPDLNQDSLRTAIGRACKATGTPLWSPHDLRHRRISLLHDQGRSWAQIAAFVGQRKLSITADTYTHVLIDPAELDYAELLR
jgi:integrase